MIRPGHLSRLLAVVASLAIVGSSAAIVSAAGLGGTKSKSASAVQYLTKPGCGPDSTDGVAGNSGRHTGQPPKAPNRQDCPNPPGQQK